MYLCSAFPCSLSFNSLFLLLPSISLILFTPTKAEVSAEDAEAAAAAEKEAAGEKFDYKESSGFAKHMKEQKESKKAAADAAGIKGGGGASEFSRTKTLAEQRQFLPVYTVLKNFAFVVIYSLSCHICRIFLIPAST
jgi:hypothetical protein